MVLSGHPLNREPSRCSSRTAAADRTYLDTNCGATGPSAPEHRHIGFLLSTTKGTNNRVAPESDASPHDCTPSDEVTTADWPLHRLNPLYSSFRFVELNRSSHPRMTRCSRAAGM